MTDNTQTFEHPLTEPVDRSSKTGWIVTAVLMLTVVGVVLWLISDSE